MQHFLEFSPEVQQAIHDKKPLLALESTLITHGFPYPTNIEIAKELEQIARAHHVTPATIAIMNGKIKIGLTEQELENLVHDKKSVKASTRDLGFILSQKLNAGTTVAATLFCARQANIKVFATGGIGGVHRGDDLDISADLIELSRTPIAVVCAGAKSILDLPKTLEFLETFSIPVVGYGTHHLPAFYTASTAHPLPMRADDIQTLAQIISTHWQLGLHSGALVTNPIPNENEIPNAEIEPIILAALKQAENNKISGKAITPFLLNEVVRTTQGKSMQANLHLLRHNAKIGAQLAAAL